MRPGAIHMEIKGNAGRMICIAAIACAGIVISGIRTAHAAGSMSFSFAKTEFLEEAGSMQESTSPYFWVNSGGAMITSAGIGSTYIGNQSGTKWGKLYKKENPLDTDNGMHPQNLFRLITKGIWGNITQQAYFVMRTYYASASPNRDGHNGMLFMSRYQDDGDTLYYAGIRVDGQAIIKKKYKGEYVTLAGKKLFSGTFDRTKNPNLLPLNAWIGIRTAVQDVPGGVSIRLFVDRKGNGEWKEVLSATDTGKILGPAIRQGYGGIRTDFADVQFKSYSITD